jgi:hypothetical protein
MQKVSKMNVYKPLLASGTTVATNLPPFEHTPGMVRIEQKHKPAEWWVSKCGAPVVGV